MQFVFRKNFARVWQLISRKLSFYFMISLPMKKFLILLAIGGFSMIARVEAAMIDDAVAWAYTKGLTRYYTNEAF
jgi:hypothetical protein